MIRPVYFSSTALTSLMLATDEMMLTNGFGIVPFQRYFLIESSCHREYLICILHLCNNLDNSSSMSCFNFSHFYFYFYFLLFFYFFIFTVFYITV